jgi:hypothetical protein
MARLIIILQRMIAAGHAQSQGFRKITGQGMLADPADLSHLSHGVLHRSMGFRTTYLTWSSAPFLI